MNTVIVHGTAYLSPTLDEIQQALATKAADMRIALEAIPEDYMTYATELLCFCTFKTRELFDATIAGVLQQGIEQGGA